MQYLVGNENLIKIHVRALKRKKYLEAKTDEVALLIAGK